MVKNRILPCLATGLYPDRVSSISFSVRDVISCLREISSESILELDKILMAASSSKIFPCKVGTVAVIILDISENKLPRYQLYLHVFLRNQLTFTNSILTAENVFGKSLPHY